MKEDLSISQNFLINSDFVSKLINSIEITTEDTMVDIGAGKGIITEILSRKAKEVVAIEYDHKLFLKLKNKFSNIPNIKVLNIDFMKYDLPKSDFKVFANPPFNISADIINKILKLPNNMKGAYLILQKETVDRFSNGHSQISSLWQPFYDISVIQRIDKNEFRPTPKVDIVLSKFEKKEMPLVNISDYQLYRDFIIYGFNQWKPTIVESLQKVFTSEQFKIINKKYNLSHLKPSDLNLDQWLGLFETFLKFVPSDKKKIVQGYESTQNNKQKNMIKRHRTNI